LGPSGFIDNQVTKVAYTRRLTDSDRDQMSAVSVTATTLQEFVPKSFEVRLTVIGDAWFPIAIHAGTERSYTDWRSDRGALAHGFVPVPDHVVDGVSQYLCRMNLAYAGLSFVVTPDDRWVLLEANTGPEFGWLEAATGAAMTEAMADLLQRGVAPW
jgi:hypothetical protein